MTTILDEHEHARIFPLRSMSGTPLLPYMVRGVIINCVLGSSTRDEARLSILAALTITSQEITVEHRIEICGSTFGKAAAAELGEARSLTFMSTWASSRSSFTADSTLNSHVAIYYAQNRQGIKQSSSCYCQLLLSMLLETCLT